MTTLVENLPSGTVVGGRVRRFRSVITLASQAQAAYSLFRVPPGHVFAYGVITTDTSLGSSTAAIGTAGSSAKYKAAAVFTATDTPTLFGKAAAIGAAAATSSTVGSSPKGTGADEDVILTVGAASLPSSGTLVIDMYFSAT